MLMIVTVSWAIYPAGYVFGYLFGAVDDAVLNVIYNIVDLVNRVAIVLACWSGAKSDLFLCSLSYPDSPNKNICLVQI